MTIRRRSRPTTSRPQRRMSHAMGCALRPQDRRPSASTDGPARQRLRANTPKPNALTRGIPCEGIDLSEEMLAVARAKFHASGVNVGLRAGDMAQFELGRQFPLIFSASNSLLHLHATSNLLSCFRSVRRHLQPGGRFAFDVFNPSVRMLASADGVRREMQRFIDPERGEVRVDAAKRYDAEARSAERSGISRRRANRTSSWCRSSCAASSLRSCRCKRCAG